MATEQVIKDVLLRYRNIATVGFSKDPTKPSHTVPKFLIEKGYNVIPINPTVQEILGRKSYPTLRDVPDYVDVVQIFRPSSELKGLVQEVISRKRSKGDVKVIWAQEGIKDDEAAKIAEREGLIVIQDKCMYKEYIRLLGR
jgi:predicted CoA-binding protein